jgi:hypothetical protein
LALTASAFVPVDYFGSDISCNGCLDGQATVVAEGGVEPWAYSWSSGDTTVTTASDLPDGWYTVTVADVNGCTVSESVVLADPAVLRASAFVSSDFNSVHVSCVGSSDGEATAIATGGTSPWSFLWTSGETVATTTLGLAAGTHTVTVTDVNNYATTSSVVLLDPDPLALSMTTSTHNSVGVSCFGSSDGTASASASGGVGSWVYSWSVDGTGGTVVGELSAGRYTVTVVDANSCRATSTVNTATVWLV